ncbi:MAG: PKD domain-containing protein, partial [Gammaproteobacteria bacterium]|nr:PKD domain-containing protein [Gammaproteobacteria bacterium]
NNPTSWQWDFGDGGSSTLENPSHTYNSNGYYTVSLTVTNGYGSDTDTKTNYITVDNFTCPPSFTDSRDGNVYSAVQIGSQCWMQENLAYLPSVSPSSDGSNTTPRYYVYDYQGTDVNAAKATSNYQTYGVLYNWLASMNGQASSSSVPSGVQGICPNGWHLPSDEEWKILEGEVDSWYGYPNAEWDGGGLRGTDADGNLKEIGTTHWNSPNSATNSSGFTALPAGYRSYDGLFNFLGNFTYFWSSTEYSSSGAWIQRGLSYAYAGVDRSSYSNGGSSVRCTKDSGTLLDANFSGNPITGTSPLTVYFTDQSSNSPTSWLWDFGDGLTSSQQNPGHTYSSVGYYTVSLTATNSYGSDTEVKTDYIVVNTPVADFSGSPSNGTAPLNVSFTDQSQNNPTSWQWDFGDGGSSTL